MVAFAGCVLLIGVLYWAQALLVPFALAVLLTFVLTPAVSGLERWIGRVPAVLVAVTLVFTILGLAGWGLARQMDQLAQDLPRYRVNILAKIADVRGAGRGGSVEKLQKTIEDIKTGLEQPDGAKAPASRPLVVTSPYVTGFSAFTWLGPIVGPLGTAGLVVAMVIFMLLERRDLRDRLIGLVGHGRLTITTKAFDEAGTRVSRQLLMQSLVNLLYGTAAGTGLYLLGVPYALVWAVLGAALRFIPYLGPAIGAGAPIAVSLAALDGWAGPLWVVALFAGLELFTNLVLETVLYAGAAGVSQVALLVSVAFWTWLWGPLGLLMATPLTVCLVVLGQARPGPGVRRNSDGRYARPGPGVRLLPASAGARSERGRRSDRAAHQDPATAFGLRCAAAAGAQLRGTRSPRAAADTGRGSCRHRRDAANWWPMRRKPTRRAHRRTRCLRRSLHPCPDRESRCACWATPPTAVADELALAMLAHVVDDLPIVIEIIKTRPMTSEVVALVQAQGVSVVCLADLPPSPTSKTRYLVKRLRAALPELRILVGRWGPPALADESTQVLREAGATLVATTLADTRTYLGGLVELPRIPALGTDATQAR